jgi:hypothetical protein
MHVIAPRKTLALLDVISRIAGISEQTAPSMV